MRDYLALTGDTSDNVPGVPAWARRPPSTCSPSSARRRHLRGPRRGQAPQAPRALCASTRPTRASRSKLVTLDASAAHRLGRVEAARGAAPTSTSSAASSRSSSFTGSSTSSRTSRRTQAAARRWPASAAGGAGARPPKARFRVVLDEAALEHVVAEAREAGALGLAVQTTGADAMRATLIGLSLASEAGRGHYVPLAAPLPRVPAAAPVGRGAARSSRRCSPIPRVTKVGHDVKHVVHRARARGRARWSGPRLRHPRRGLPASTPSRRTTLKELAQARARAVAVAVRGHPREDARARACLRRARGRAGGVLRRPGRRGAARAAGAVRAAHGRRGARQADARRRDAAVARARGDGDARRARRRGGAGRALRTDVEQQPPRHRGRLQAPRGARLPPALPRPARGHPLRRARSCPWSSARRRAAARPTPTSSRRSPRSTRCRRASSSTASSTSSRARTSTPCPSYVDPATGRIHTRFDQAVAATGRLSSSDPNLQNIPIRTELGRSIRAAFVAPPGHVILSADYSQIELRVLGAPVRGRGARRRLRERRGRARAHRRAHLRQGARRRSPPTSGGPPRRSTSASSTAWATAPSPSSSASRASRRRSSSRRTSPATRAWRGSWSAPSRRRARARPCARCSGAVGSCRTCTRPTARCASRPSASRATRPSRERPRTS